MLSGLPSSYDPMVMVLEHSKDTLTSETVKVKLLQEDNKLQDSHDEASALLSSSDRHKDKVQQCYECKGYGHFKSQCPNSQRQPNPSKTKQKKKKGKSRHPPKSTLLAALNTQQVGTGWVIDSGASSHMSNDKISMEHFNVDVSEPIKVANNEI